LYAFYFATIALDICQVKGVQGCPKNLRGQGKVTIFVPIAQSPEWQHFTIAPEADASIYVSLMASHFSLPTSPTRTFTISRK
jgi:hypothetical protein